MRDRLANIGTGRWIVIAVAILMILVAWQQTLAAGRGLITRDVAGEIPLRFVAPAGEGQVPGVVVAHGFAGSKQLMYGFGYALARAGYGVMLFDFEGHGGAGGGLSQTTLQRDLAAAREALLAQPEIDPAQVALLGHSMGSGAVMTAAIAAPDQYRATVAVSPTSAAVTPDSPRNLLLMAGSLEPQFLGNAHTLLAAAGGSNDDLSAGLGRALVEIPFVEHITILFSRASRQAALDWLDRVFDRPSSLVAPDRRLVWFGVHLGGWLLLAVALGPLLPAGAPPAVVSRRPWRWLGLPLGALVAALVLYIASRLFDVSSLGGMLVGGAIGLWFLVLGLVWLPLGFRPPRPARDDLLWGLLLFALLTLAFGLMAHFTWLPWALTAARLARCPFVAAAVLPWLLASALAQQDARPAARLGWWLYQSVVVVVGLALTIQLAPQLSFIFLLLPVFPVVLGILGVAGLAFRRPWAFALGSALFFGWLLVAVFPLA
jgi:dienelactone hydrolase